MRACFCLCYDWWRTSHYKNWMPHIPGPNVSHSSSYNLPGCTCFGPPSILVTWTPQPARLLHALLVRACSQDCPRKPTKTDHFIKKSRHFHRKTPRNQINSPLGFFSSILPPQNVASDPATAPLYTRLLTSYRDITRFGTTQKHVRQNP